MKKILSIVLVMVLLASAAPMAITPAAAISDVYEEKIAGDADENGELTKEELVNAILPYMLGEGELALDDVGDASYVYACWNGKPRTFKDSYDRTVTVSRPIERIVATSPNTLKTIIALGACDKLVATAKGAKWCTCYGAAVVSGEKAPICATNVCGGRLFELPEVGKTSGIDNIELVVPLKPDLIFDSSRRADATQEKTGIPTVAIRSSGHDLDTIYEEFETMGVVLEKEQEAEEMISFVKEKVAKLEEVTSEIPESDKPRVYIATRSHGYVGKVTSTTGRYYPIDIAGGINVAIGISGSKVSKEQIIDWNPDIILVVRYADYAGDPVEMVLSDPDLQTVNAVKDKRINYTTYAYCYGTPQDRNLAAAFYLAKLFHPDKFPDLNVEEEGNEIFKAFLRADGLFSEYADYQFWMREFLDKQQKS